mmetsp:Transcript_23923/g.80772  ORF Transcript_23923/g.80772 Transcript_23923/m.80772 type:complete len:96 (-) Transcript_23923:1422-1709(-)
MCKKCTALANARVEHASRRALGRAVRPAATAAAGAGALHPCLPMEDLNLADVKFMKPAVIDMTVKAPPMMAKTEVMKSYHLRSPFRTTTSTGERS